MTSSFSAYDLRRDEFAVVFDSDTGVDANELGIFFQRLATVGRQAGADLRVLAHERGSLAVIIRAISRSANAEFNRAPIGTTASGVAIGGATVGLVTAAVVAAMSLTAGRATALAKAGAELVESHGINNIKLVTINQTFVVMDEKRVLQLRALERHRKVVSEAYNAQTFEPTPEVRRLISDARKGLLSGSIYAAAGGLHFRPDGYHFMVPVDTLHSSAAGTLLPD